MSGSEVALLPALSGQEQRHRVTTPPGMEGPEVRSRADLQRSAR
jgi:hypothetical protein